MVEAYLEQHAHLLRVQTQPAQDGDEAVDARWTQGGYSFVRVHGDDALRRRRERGDVLVATCGSRHVLCNWRAENLSLRAAEPAE